MIEAARLVFEDDFQAAELAEDVWLPHYLPAWSSRATSAASYQIRDSCLHLMIPPDQGLWCADEHTPPLRVSGIQSGNFSGPVGSTVGQQPYREGITVREQQETFWGWTPERGYIELRARAVLTPRSMVAFWMVGLEDRPERSAEICVAEIFGSTVTEHQAAAVGLGLHPFRDPAVSEDFEAVRLPIDVGDFHRYAVDWTPERADFIVDGELVRSCARPPSYPMQMMLAVFDFPELSNGDDVDAIPELVVDHLRGYERAATTRRYRTWRSSTGIRVEPEM
jgi:Glycosyl hydrolases family 16